MKKIPNKFQVGGQKIEIPMPEGLMKFAEQTAQNVCNNEIPELGYTVYERIMRAVIIGARWMAEQGVVVEGKFHRSCGYPSVIELNTYLRDYDGDKVIVQIRKKEE